MQKPVERAIYTLDTLSPEVRAVTFAKCSRSPESFKEIAEELTDESSSKFHEKWIVGYGHSSVAEHAVLSIAIENVSILATKVIEDNRLASYTEKSTRYQVFDKSKLYMPKEIMESEHKDLYQKTSFHLMDAYQKLTEEMVPFMEKNYLQEPDVSDALYKMRIKNKVLDAVRYILPVSILTNLGMTVNARNLEHALRKLLTHPLSEMQKIGNEIKEAALKATPTLIKYVEYNDYLGKTCSEMAKLCSTIETESYTDKEGPTLVHYDPDAENKIVASILYRFSSTPYEVIWKNIIEMDDSQKEKIIDTALKDRGKFDAPLREFEHVSYTTDILIDYGAFRDIQRHRMCTQTNQDFNTDHGYAIPDDIVDAGFEKEYRECMDIAKKAYDTISKTHPKEAQYIVPMGYRKRVLFTWNLRALHHFISLRSGKTGHISYRKVAQQLYDLIESVHPVLARYIRVDRS